MCSSTWVCGRWTMFFCSGIHEEQVEEPPHLSYGLVHLIFCTTILHNWQFPFWWFHHQVEGHKNLILPWCLVVDGVYWGSLNFFSRSPFYWGIFLSIPSFAHKKIVGIHLFFDFVETHMWNDCIGWFSTLKHILKTHASLWSRLGDFYLVFLELSCVMWMLENLEFGV
jgi:hypothetical protein